MPSLVLHDGDRGSLIIIVPTPLQEHLQADQALLHDAIEEGHGDVCRWGMREGLREAP
jgi:hypothetical protein